MPYGNQAPQGNIECSPFCPHRCFRDSSSKHTSDLEGTPLHLLQRNCSDCFCTTRVIAMRQLWQLAYKTHQKENHRFPYNATKQVVKWNREVTVNCNQATWNLVKRSQSKYRNMGFERLKKGGGGWSHKNSLMPQRANTSKYFLVEFNSNKAAFLIPRHFTCRQFFESITKYQTEVNSSGLAFVISVIINTLSSLSLTLSIPFSDLQGIVICVL